jgi:alpha-N-arabinofuranosidase
MYQVHQDATLLPVNLKSADYSNGSEKISALSVSASKDNNNKIHLSIVNLDPVVSHKVTCEVRGETVSKVSGEIITADKMNAMNDFGKPEEVNIKTFEGAKFLKGILDINLPAKSVVTLELD